MSYLKENDLLKTFKSYLLDTKPYHVKLDRIFAHYLFNDDFRVSLIENKHDIHIYFQNIFNTSLFGGWRLYHDIESSINSRKFLIPQTIIPRFSINSFEEQFPVGHDPATENSQPSINEVPWAPPGTQLTRQGWSYSHQTGVVDENPYVPDTAFIEIEITSISPINSGNVTFTYTRHIYYDTSNLYGANFSLPKVFKNNIELQDTGPVPYFVFDNIDEKISIIGLTKTFKVEIDSGKILLTENINGQNLITDLTYAALAESILYIDDINVPETITLITPHVKLNLFNDNQGISFNFFGSGEYKVPFHNGSYVTVNGNKQIFGIDYIVNGLRNSIQFLDGKHPELNDDIRINYFNVDRLFIALTRPFDVDVQDGFDDRSYDNFPFDSFNISNSLYNTDYFELTVDSSLPGGYKVEFFNAIDGTSKASIQDVKIYPGANNKEKWTLVATGPKILSVTGSMTGDSGIAIYRQRYDNGQIAFTIKNTYLPYYMVPDNPQPPLPSPPVGTTATYSDIDYNLFNIFTFGGSRDTQDYLLNLNLTSTHGISDDFNSQTLSYFDDPVSLLPFGKITVNKNREYFFELTNSQPLGSALEIWIEQNTQYNTWVEIKLKENLIINNINLVSDYLDIVKFGYDIPDFDTQGLDIVLTRDLDGTLHNEPFQIATAGIQENLKFSINYVDATPDSIIQESTIYSDKFVQSTPINELILKRFPYVDGSPGTGPAIFRSRNLVFTPISSANGTLSLLKIESQDIEQQVEQTWTITSIDGVNFSVVGSITGVEANAEVDVPYSNDYISFTIKNGNIPYDLAGGDEFTFDVSGGFVVTSLDSGAPDVGVITPDVIFNYRAKEESPVVSGVGNGTIKLTNIDQTQAVEETWTITATSPTNFTVTGSISGALSNATVGTQYNDIISFKITNGLTSFVSGDEFTIEIKKDWSIIHIKFSTARTFDLYLI